MASSATVEHLNITPALLGGRRMSLVTIDWDTYATGGITIICNSADELDPTSGDKKLGKVIAAMFAGNTGLAKAYNVDIELEAATTDDQEIVVKLSAVADGTEPNTVDLSGKTTKILTIGY